MALIIFKICSLANMLKFLNFFNIFKKYVKFFDIFLASSKYRFANKSKQLFAY